MSRKEILLAARRAVVFLILLAALAWNLRYTVGFAFYQLSEIIPNLRASSDDKWRRVLGEYYDLIRFVRDRTPPDARILLPPREDLPLNLWMHNYFWLPRPLFVSDRPEAIAENAIAYVVVIRDSPAFPVAGERIMLNETQGIIKVKREEIVK